MNFSTQQTHELYDLGLAYIRAAIRANLAEVDTEIAAAGILHPAWSRSLPPPESIPISVMPACAPVVTVEFTGREIQDSWRGVEGADTCRKIRAFGLEYLRLRAEVDRYPGHRGIVGASARPAPNGPSREPR